MMASELIEENMTHRMIFKSRSSVPIDVGLHSYQRFRLGYILSGSKRFVINEQVVTGSAGEMFFIPQGLHHIENVAPTHGGDYEEILFSYSSSELISVLPPSLLSMLAEAFTSSDYDDIIDGSLPLVATPSRITTDVFLAIDARYNLGGFVGSTLIEQVNLANVITSIIQCDSHAFKRSIIKTLNQDQAQFERVIYENIFADRRLCDLADELHRSLTSFKKEFKRLFSCSPHSWFINQRMQHAKSMLTITDDSVSNIAQQCSVNSASHFIKLYKNYYGMTPAEHRKLLRSSL